MTLLQGTLNLTQNNLSVKDWANVKVLITVVRPLVRYLFYQALCQFGHGAGGFADSSGDLWVKWKWFMGVVAGFNIRGLADTHGFSWGWLDSGWRVNGLPHEVPSGNSILTLGVLGGFLYLAEEFALMLWVRSLGCVSCLCGEFLWLHTKPWSLSQIAVGALVVASGENVG